MLRVLGVILVIGKCNYLFLKLFKEIKIKSLIIMNAIICKEDRTQRMMNIVFEACKENNITPISIDKLTVEQIIRLREKTMNRDDILLYSLIDDYFLYKTLERYDVSKNVCNRNKKILGYSFNKQRKVNVCSRECYVCYENRYHFFHCPTCTNKELCYECSTKLTECPICRNAKKEFIEKEIPVDTIEMLNRYEQFEDNIRILDGINRFIRNKITLFDMMSDKIYYKKE